MTLFSSWLKKTTNIKLFNVKQDFIKKLGNQMLENILNFVPEFSWKSYQSFEMDTMTCVIYIPG